MDLSLEQISLIGHDKLTKYALVALMIESVPEVPMDELSKAMSCTKLSSDQLAFDARAALCVSTVSAVRNERRSGRRS